MNSVIEARLLEKREAAPNIFDYVIERKDGLLQAKAGQFIHIWCGDGVYLRRPISICEVTEDTLRFLFEVRGKGTKALAQYKIGDTMNLLGPLGRGFSVNKELKNPVVIGGGIGIYPLLQVAKETKAKAILGFREKNLITLEKEFNEASSKVYITTDDGSYGTHGLVTDVLKELIENGEVDGIFACGPMPMLGAIKDVVGSKEIFLEVSLEQRMGCGIGACLCCATKIADEKLEEGFSYTHICNMGPVFNGKDVILS